MDEPEREEFSDTFSCCVCLDLLYKPIVLSCGHISCFWCVHHSMSSSVRESHCPLCRHPYYHFPTVCQMLHFLLLKMYRVAYKRRETQMLDKEKRTGYFSPQFHSASGSQIKSDSMCGSPSSSIMDHKSNSYADPLVSLNHNSYIYMELSDLSREGHDEGKIRGKSEASETLPVEGSHCEQKEPISVADVLCTACNQLLHRPVFLNCGHAYCEVCIFYLSDEVLKCQLCQSPHPMGFPKVCLVLDQFLEERFPYEYAQRRDTIQLRENEVKHKTASTCLADTPEGKDRLLCWTDPNSKPHSGVGCDFCGMFPLVGDRYRCKDCVEKIGFDLCGDCYDTRSNLPGRFNQQHTPEHKFERLQASGLIENRHIPIINVASQSLEVVFQAPAFSDDSDEDHNTETSN